MVKPSSNWKKWGKSKKSWFKVRSNKFFNLLAKKHQFQLTTWHRKWTLTHRQLTKAFTHCSNRTSQYSRIWAFATLQSNKISQDLDQQLPHPQLSNPPLWSLERILICMEHNIMESRMDCQYLTVIIICNCAHLLVTLTKSLWIFIND